MSSVSIIGHSAPMQQVFDTVAKVAATSANVLILGENGTGKELVARSLHAQSARAGSAFVAVDMGAITESLFESELFGHVKGAFTDAREDRTGRFELAQGGTLFLDEIGNLSLPLQAKLLTVLQQRQVVRVGANRPIAVDIRLVSATNRPLRSMAAQHAFRQDLLYRLNTVEIHLPPLRERREDIPLLAQHFVRQYAARYQRPVQGVSRAALRALDQYPWPGNVRELQHAIERAVILSEAEYLQVGDFSFDSLSPAGDQLTLTTFNLAEVEKAVIRRVLDRCQGNISQAAQILGLTRTSLYRRIEKHEL